MKIVISNIASPLILGCKMKLICLMIFVLIVTTNCLAQDMIVTKSNDTINCKITKIDSTQIMFDMDVKGTMVSTYLPRESILDYKYNYFYKNFLELGGASLFSINYERIFPIKNSFSLSARAGIGLNPYEIKIPLGNSSLSGTIPISVSYLLGNKFSFENGLGLCLGNSNSEGLNGTDGQGIVKWFNGILGLRFQKPNGNFLFRLNYTPHIGYYQNSFNDQNYLKVKHWFGLSFGMKI